MKHTPGPWKVNWIEWKNIGRVYYIEDDVDFCAELYITDPNQEANADLIASAPDMLEALEAVRKYVTFRIHLEYEKKTAEMVDKAIAKAKGKEK